MVAVFPSSIPSLDLDFKEVDAGNRVERASCDSVVGGGGGGGSGGDSLIFGWNKRQFGNYLSKSS